ncbi:MAG: transporter [Burkholderiaceae bacterium]|jgi:type IV secretion system protein VirB4|nr:transporter [Burkholderiaceae bacterium]
MWNLREFRSKALALPDLLPWAFLVENGIVLTKQGGLLAGWEFIGPDLDSATRAELTAMAARINRALMLGEGWVIHCDAIRESAPGYAPEGAFPDRTTRLIDDARHQTWSSHSPGFRSRYVLTVTWFAEPDAANKVANLFVEGRSGNVAQRNLERFKERLGDIEGALSGFLNVRRLADFPAGHPDQAQGFDPWRDVGPFGAFASPLLGHLDQCTMPAVGFRPLVFGEVPMYLDSFLGTHDFQPGFVPFIDEHGVACLEISQLPASSHPGLMDFLSRMPVEYRWSSRFVALDMLQAEKIINRHRSKWANKRISMLNHFRQSQGGQVSHYNLDAVNMTNDAVDALAENSSGEVLYGYYTSVILISHTDPAMLEGISREVAKFIRQQGFGVRIESVNAVEAWMGTLPGNTVANVRRPLIHTLNLAHLLPLTAVWAGADEHPCPFYPPHSPPLFFAKTDGATPLRVSLHSGDLGHTVIVGPTGAGKSTLLGLIAAQQFRYPRAQVFVFDKGYSMQPLVWAAGGEHYDIAGDGMDELTFCPLGRIGEPSEQDWAAEWIEGLVQLQGVEVTPTHRKRIYEAVVSLAQSTDRPEQRTLTNYVLAVQDNQLRDALNAYTLRGAGGKLLDAESDALREDSFQVFEMEHLMQKGEKLLLPVLLYLFHRLEQRFNGQPSLLVLDEAWVMFGHGVFKQKIFEWLKVLRKLNVAVVFSTQSLADLNTSGIADVIFESCPTKILLANPAAVTDNVRPMYERMGLNERQIQIVAQGVPKKDYYMVHADGKRQFELGLSRAELAFVGVSDRENLGRIRKLKKEIGDPWPVQWLTERGLPDVAQRWAAYA